MQMRTALQVALESDLGELASQELQRETGTHGATAS